MTDGEILCNFKKCRKVLTNNAYITRCSHAFCEEDGIRQIENQISEKKCPACLSPLTKNYDLVKVKLNPNDQFKSMVLAGLRPETVMDIATRAIMFWSYQQHQEHLHQELMSKNLRDMINQIKSEAEVESGRMKSEIQVLRRKLEDTEKDLQKHKLKCGELSEKIAEKTRAVQKWQIMYESLRRKQLATETLHPELQSASSSEPIAKNIGPQTMNEMIAENRKQDYGISPSPKPYNNNRDGFIFQPRSMKGFMSPKMFIENGGGFKAMNGRGYQN